MSAMATGVTLPTAMSLASRAEAEVPRAGGHLRAALTDPADFDGLLRLAVGNTLTEETAEGRITGELARRLTAEEAGARWVIDLRPDAVFHDGRPLLPEDVAAVLTKGLPDAVSVRETGPAQLVLTLRRPDMGLPERLAAPELAVLRTGPDGRMVGTGGYRIEAEEGGTVTLVRAAGYWKPGRAHLDAVTLARAGSAGAMLSDVMAGRLDYAAGIAPETTANLANLPGVAITETPAVRALVLTTAAGAGRDGIGAVRALRAAVDRGDFVARALLGHGVTGADDVLPPAGVAARGSGVIPAEAPFSIGSDEPEAWVSHLTEIARRAGVPIGAAGAGPALHARRMTAAALAGWAATSEGTAALFAHDAAAAAAFAGDLAAARAVATRAARQDAIRRVFQDFRPEAGLFVPAWANDLAARSARLVHPAARTPHRPHDGYRMIERWWFA